MFFIKKILAHLLMPPGIFIILLLCSAIWLFIKKYYTAGIVNFLLGLLIWLLSIAPVSDFMMRGLESGFTTPGNPTGDVIILLGAGAYDKVPDLTGTGSPTPEMLARIVTAVRIQKRLHIPVIVSGGRIYLHKSAEAPIDGRFLRDLGVSANKIILEGKSRDTVENARYTEKICKKHGFKRPILVTSAYHMKRALLSFKKVDMDITPVPANFKTWENAEYHWEDYLPGVSELEKTSIAIHEYFGLLLYTFAY